MQNEHMIELLVNVLLCCIILPTAVHCSNLNAKESGRVETVLSQRESVAAPRGGESDLSRCIVAPAHRARRTAD